MKRLYKRDIGSVFVVRFLDHVENAPEPAVTEAMGRLRGFDRRTIRLRAWGYPDDPKAEEHTDYAILRSTVSEITQYVPG